MSRYPPSQLISASKVSEHINNRIHDLTQVEFNYDGRGGLPIREDSGDSLIVSSNHGMYRNADVVPDVHLLGDGTVTVTFYSRHGMRLTFRVPCWNVFLFTKVFEGGKARVDGRLNYPSKADFDPLFDWLNERPA